MCGRLSHLAIMGMSGVQKSEERGRQPVSRWGKVSASGRALRSRAACRRRWWRFSGGGATMAGNMVLPASSGNGSAAVAPAPGSDIGCRAALAGGVFHSWVSRRSMTIRVRAARMMSGRVCGAGAVSSAAIRRSARWRRSGRWGCVSVQVMPVVCPVHL